MPQRQKCICCGGRKAELTHGVAHCKNPDCGAMFWAPFTTPQAGGKGRGSTCFNCSNLTMHDMGKVGTIVVERCSTCGATFLHPDEH